MQKKFVMGILPYQSANTALDNLAEAEFTNISVIMNDLSKARQLADDTGPLQGLYGDHVVEALKKYLIPENKIVAVKAALEKGSVLVAFSAIAESVDAAKEMLQNAGATHIQSI